MSEAAPRGMTVDEFLRWEDGTDTRYELVCGEIRRREVASAIHSALLARLGALIHDALKPQPEQVALLSAALAILGCADTCYLADIAVAPTPERWDDRLIRDPILIVEILSPSTTAFDRQTKVPDYRRIASVREILLVDSESVFAEILRREGDHWITEIVQGPVATLSLSSVPLTIPMAELYDGIPLPEPRPSQAGIR